MGTQIKTQSRSLEVAMRLEQGVSTAEIYKEFISKWECDKRTINRYIAFAKDIVGERLEDREKIMEILRAEAIAEDFDNNMISTLEVECKLCKIVSENVSDEHILKTKEGYINVHTKARVSQIIRAAHELLSLRGKLNPKNKKEERQADDPFEKAKRNFALSREGFSDNYSPETGRLIAVVSNEAEKRAIENI